ncbi:hypothetical protein ACODM8_07635 [Vibrio ostreicida]|uniref:Uncharacterized protein n=1 Tax=Vibrio ostreicida TaxID=526588 RepID=A0ABT8BQX4_9VIBR|nr:hypothetical protein [Vibrio ostreicida]MDN3608854.1 hypothetical protein [Vibrio ostreicida]NPD09888.1 hypothetical protein [Vibrio ostreicida]
MYKRKGSPIHVSQAGVIFLLSWFIACLSAWVLHNNASDHHTDYSPLPHVANYR